MDVLPELQSFAFHSAFDIEWIDPLAEGGELTEDVVDRILCGAKDDNSWLIVSLCLCSSDLAIKTCRKKGMKY
ncbi:unnamed protein product [Angiostrongylus costaricensis]|uniref:Calpain catalytic domain-containing protein n=1 Tax=Angiostrongylus costaricensis TaxID=334426 RepID=A0A0R3PP25_ANGCS|nr:unnamed protein product [Angiostrongylus costaricensis]